MGSIGLARIASRRPPPLVLELHGPTATQAPRLLTPDRSAYDHRPARLIRAAAPKGDLTQND
jgi:hypothetical protein